MEIYNTLVQFFQQGGPFMYPILGVLAVGVAIALERALFLSKVRRHDQRTWNQLMPLIQAGKYDEARAYAENTPTGLSRILSYGLGRMGGARHRDDIELAMEEGLMEVVPRVEKRTHYLATLANTATLLGLLGTIIGLIQAFTAVASAAPAERADMLSASISVAMNTTAFGLSVGILLLVLHAMLQTKSTQVTDSLEMASVKVLNLIHGTRRGDEGATA